MKQQYYLHIPIDCVDHIRRKNRSSLRVLVAICLIIRLLRGRGAGNICVYIITLSSRLLYLIKRTKRIFCNENS